MAHEVETLAFVESRGLPWHGLGTPVEGLMTSAEALAKAELDWAVEKRAATFVPAGGGFAVVPGYNVVVRATDQKPLGIVGSVHTTVQNADAFAWGDQIVAAEDGAHWETAGSLRDGRVVFMSMEIPASVKVPGDDGEIKPYLLITNGHDGKRSLEAAITPVRTVCMNTLNLGLRLATRKITIRHATKISDRMGEAAEVLGVTYKYMAALQATADRLMLKKVTDAQVEEILRKVWPVGKTFDNPERLDMTDFAGALKVYRTSPNLANIRGTGWAVLNAVAEYTDHVMDYSARRWSPADTKMRSLTIDGVGMRRKQKALRLIEAA